MHGQQCQSCGAYDDSSTRSVNPCEHCPTPLCRSCKRNHGPLCKELQARKLRGEGPTIGNVPMFAHRRGHETPPTTGPDRPNVMEHARKSLEKNADLLRALAVDDNPNLMGQYTTPDSTPSPVSQALVDKSMLVIVQGFKDLIDGTYGSVDKLEVEAIDRQLDALKDMQSEQD